MKLGLMQPYLFPYLGYFQLIHATDKFVFYDDVNFIKNGWINRNRLLLDGKPRYFTVPLAGASPFASIRDTRFDAGDARWRRKLLATFAQAYKGAPHFGSAMGLIEDTLSLETDSIAELARHSVKSVLGYLGVQRTIADSSQVYANAHLRGPERVLDICRRESARVYVNAPGGRGLYNVGVFRDSGIELRFLDGRLPTYLQGSGEFVPGLSILDIVMRCRPEEIRTMLSQYDLVQ